MTHLNESLNSRQKRKKKVQNIMQTQQIWAWHLFAMKVCKTSVDFWKGITSKANWFMQNACYQAERTVLNCLTTYKECGSISDKIPAAWSFRWFEIRDKSKKDYWTDVNKQANKCLCGFKTCQHRFLNLTCILKNIPALHSSNKATEDQWRHANISTFNKCMWITNIFSLKLIVIFCETDFKLYRLQFL